ncbi:MAG TPA: nuclear transport factor 2 family protein [Solirubrobacteraceae bacterium]|jgi:ketosteroid isomerase-like protein|nr:nuclear transport factor 2 family protein [Solirubrobacteraceae bacterium]
MSTTEQSPEIATIERLWEAVSRGDFEPLRAALAPDAVWRTVDDGPNNCTGAETIVELMSAGLGGRARGSIEEVFQDGARVIVGFRPADRGVAERRPLDAYVVVGFDGQQIVELKGCADRAGAVAYARTGSPSAVAGPATAVEPPGEKPEQRVERLIPFVRVADVERSAAFYAHFGFAIAAEHRYRDRLAWVALESDRAELMLEGCGEPIEPDRQRVLFYLYARDLRALRKQLLAAGIAAGEVEDGSPGPSEEMRVVDPDGYVLMVAAIEE